MSNCIKGRAIATLMANANQYPSIMDTKIGIGELTLADVMAYQNRKSTSILEWCLLQDDSTIWGEENTLLLRVGLLKADAMEALEKVEEYAAENEIPKALLYYQASINFEGNHLEGNGAFMTDYAYLDPQVRTYYQQVSTTA